jgi:hypothetical protein
MKTLKKKREITIERESAGFFIIDPESKKIIMTMKIADHTKAEITRNLIENKIITNKTVLKKEGKISFVKGKIEN